MSDDKMVTLIRRYGQQRRRRKSLITSVGKTGNILVESVPGKETTRKQRREILIKVFVLMAAARN
jgi:hypothetical protein